MIHYVLLKFAPGTDLDAAEARVRKTYDELDVPQLCGARLERRHHGKGPSGR